MTTTYLLHLEQPLARGVSPKGKPLQAAHYIGETEDLKTRLAEHRESTWQPYAADSTAEGQVRKGEKHGHGATFLAVANSRQINWSLARTWEEKGREFERKLKNYKNAPRLCPLCTADAMNHMKGEC